MKQQLLKNCSDFDIYFRWKGFVLPVVSLLILLSSHILKFVSLSIWIFIWAINHAKISPVPRNMDMFFLQISFVYSPKIVIVCSILFTGPHQNHFLTLFNYYFLISAPISIFLLLFKRLRFNDGTIVNNVKVDNLKFACLSVWTFVWAKNKVKIDSLSQNFYTFLK